MPDCGNATTWTRHAVGEGGAGREHGLEPFEARVGVDLRVTADVHRAGRHGRGQGEGRASGDVDLLVAPVAAVVLDQPEQPGLGRVRPERQAETGRVEVRVHVGEGGHEDAVAAVDDLDRRRDDPRHVGVGDLVDAPGPYRDVDPASAGESGPEPHTPDQQVHGDSLAYSSAVPERRADRSHRPLGRPSTYTTSLSKAIVQPVAPGESAGMPACVITIFVRPPMAARSTATSVVVGMAAGMPASASGRERVAVLVGDVFGVDEARGLDDLEVLAGEPHAHRAVRSLHLHAHPPATADTNIHLGNGDRHTVGAVPRHEVLGLGPHLPDESDRSVEGALDHDDVVGTAFVNHALRLPSVAGRAEVLVHLVEAAPPRPAGTARPRSRMASSCVGSRAHGRY